LPDPQDESTPNAVSSAAEPEVTADGTSAVATLEEGVEEETQVVWDDLGGQSLSDAIDATIVAFDDGDIVKGRVVKIDSDEVLLDIGYKSEGVIPSRELSIRNDVDPHEVVSLDEELEALVLTKEDKDGRLILSKKRAQYERAWGTIEAIKEAEGVVSGPVIEVVKGGLILDIGLRGFLPASLVDLRRVRDLHPFVGKTLDAKIIELDKNRNNVVLSRRAYLEETQREQRDEFLTNLKPGEVRSGVVSSVVNFGAFVDLGGMDGLVHVSELSWKHVDHPSSVVQVGDEVSVQVLDVDLDRERISLSLKATQQDPWQEFAGGHEVGELVYGRVTKLVPFGAFVQVGEGIEGLVHISEMAIQHVEAPEQVVTPGEELWVKIIDVDLERRRISLSIKQAAEGGTVAAEYREMYGEHNYDEAGNYIGPAFEGEAPAGDAGAGAGTGLADTVPGDTMLQAAVPADSVPADTVLQEAVPGETVPAESPAEAAPTAEVGDPVPAATESGDTAESGDEPAA
jgi:small subunit ribosomal protein S1